MKKYHFLLLLSLVLVARSTAVYAQKKTLDTVNYKEWNTAGIPVISDDGNWVLYHTSIHRDMKILVNTKSNKKLILNHTSDASFFDHGKWIRYTVSGKPKDSLLLMRLKDGKKIHWNRSEFFQNITGSPLIFYTANGKAGRNLTIRNLESGDSTVIGQTERFNLYNNGSSIIYTQGKKLVYGNVRGKKTFVADGVTDYSFNEQGKSGTYVAENKLYAFSFGQAKPDLLLDFNTISGPEGFNVVAKAYPISKADQDLQLEVSPVKPVKYQRADPPKPKVTGFDLELWTWNEDKSQRLQRKGSYLQPPQLQTTFIYHLADKKWFQLTAKNQGFVLVPDASRYNLVLETDPDPYRKMVDWRYGNNVDVYTVNTHTHERKLVATDSYSTPQWNPNGKYALLYNAQAKQWMSLNAEQNEFRQISDQIGYPVFREDHDLPSPAPAYGIAGWADGGNSILLYDKYDIWVVDLNGKKAVYSLTGGYGRKNKVVLRLQGADYQDHLDVTKPILFNGFREATKNTGLYQLLPGKQPQVLIDNPAFSVKVLAKAANGALVFSKQSYTQFPDIWYANSSVTVQKRLTEINPQQKNFNWGTAKLFKWKNFEGNDNEGLLYFPENYDAKKTYPVIVDFYETHSQDLNDYITPLYSTCTIDIPSYVSKGYVVFRPDVHFKTGQPGESAYNAVVSGTQELIRKGVADPAHIGLQGHSWSGFEVAYILTRTHLFACSNVGAGVVNSTYNYFAIRANGAPCMFKYEVEQSRIGGSLWEKKEEFIKNSPIFNADQIKTPLLIFHNDKDGAVAFTQGLDLFMAMRRLGNPAWLLNYKGQNHTLDSEQAQQDWTLRMGQFFDHYLTGKAMPRWMKEGINVDERNVDLKYDLLP